MPLTPTQKKHLRAAAARYCAVAEAKRLRRSYTQQRPGEGYELEPGDWQHDDCSIYCDKVFHFSMHETGIFVASPLNRRYSGIGNTGSSFDFVKAHPAPDDRYLVMDLAFFAHQGAGEIVHMSVCEKAGTAKTSVFSSHGHQSWVFGRDAPEPITLADESVRQHLVGVFRHPALL